MEISNQRILFIVAIGVLEGRTPEPQDLKRSTFPSSRIRNPYTFVAALG